MGTKQTYEVREVKGFINGIVVIVDKTVWGPFTYPDEALGWAIRNFKDDLFEIKNLMDPILLD